MKHIFALLRVCTVLLLLLITISTAIYRLDPATETGEEPSLSEVLSSAVAKTVQEVRTTVSGTGQAAAGTVLDAVVDASPTGEYTADGQEILEVQVPSGTVPAIREAASQQYGGTVTTDDILSQLNGVSGVQASENEDGSLSVSMPQDVYESYKSQIAGYLG